MDHYKNLQLNDDDQAKAIACLHYGVGYLEDALRDYRQLLEYLEEDPERDPTVVLTEKRADNASHAAIGYLERYRKGIKS